MLAAVGRQEPTAASQSEEEESYHGADAGSEIRNVTKRFGTIKALTDVELPP